MPRGNRWLEPGAIFHVMNRGVEHRSIFADKTDFEVFLKLLVESSQEFSLSVIGYCLMDNHFHLVVKDHSCKLSKMLRALSLKYVINFNRRHERDGPLFRGRFKSVRILSEEQLTRVIEYVHNNPAKAGLVSQPPQWQWSSSQYYTGLAQFPAWLASPGVEAIGLH